ncbi:hypothetical protein FHG87_019794, partial [Trinorchestia longiramus]
MTSLTDEVCRGLQTQKPGQQKESVVACHDLWKSCWVQGDPYQKYQASNPTAIHKSSFYPSDFHPASVFLRTSSTKLKPKDVPVSSFAGASTVPQSSSGDLSTTSSISKEKDLPKTSLSLSSSRIPTSETLNSSSADALDAAFDRSYEFALRKNASLGIGMSSKHSSTPSLNKVISTSSYQSPLVYPSQSRPHHSSDLESKHLSDAKRLNYLTQHMLLPPSSKFNPVTERSNYGSYTLSQNQTKLSAPTSTASEVPDKTSTPMSSDLSNKTCSSEAPSAQNKLSLFPEQTGSYPVQYGTLPHKSKSKPRPLQSRSGTLQRHKSSAEIYSKTNLSVQTSSLNRLLSISAEDIRRSLKETNGVIQKLIGNARKKASIKQLEVKSNDE